ncbi:MAG: thioredoxin [Clostridiales bacterium]|nr:thioredoxin [Clostridiales bacterium]
MRKNIPALILIAAGIAAVAAGICLDQHTDVLAKAIRICMECVGIG